MFPSVFDSAGILMLQSVQNILNQIGGPKLRTRLNELSNCQMLQKHLSSKNVICPTIAAYRFNNFPSDPLDISAHIMVATGLTDIVIDGKQEYFVQCKNSYRNDSSIPGKDLRFWSRIAS